MPPVTPVGRFAELRHVSDAVADLDTRAVIVVGPPGIGKSTTLRVLTAAVSSTRWVMGARCLPMSTDLPFVVVAQLLRAARNTGHGKAFQAALDRCAEFVRNELGVILPEVESTPAAPVTPPDVARMRLLDAVSAMLEQLARSRPLVLLVDDAQWIDDASRELVEYTLMSARDVTVVLAVREPAECPSAVQDTLERLRAQPMTTTVVMRPLRDDDVRLQLRQLGVPGGEAAAAIVRRAGGNPFYVEQLALVQLAGGDQDGLPPDLRRALESRTRGLSAQATSVIRLLAVAGREVRDGELHGFLGDGFGDPVREAIGAGLVARRFRPDVGSVYEMSHALLGESVASTLTDGETAALHAALAEQLAVVPGHDPAQVADHFRAAGQPERERTWRFAAADSAGRRGAWDSALRHLLRARDLIGAFDTPGDAYRLDQRVYQLLRHRGDETAAAAMAEEMLLRYGPDCDAHTRMTLLHNAGHHRTIVSAAGLVELEAAAELAAHLPPDVDVVAALYDDVRHLIYEGRFAAAGQRVGSLRDASDRIGNRELSLLTASQEAFLAVVAGDDGPMADVARELADAPVVVTGPSLNAAAHLTGLQLGAGHLDDLVRTAQDQLVRRAEVGLERASTTSAIRGDLVAGLLAAGNRRAAEHVLEDAPASMAFDQLAETVGHASVGLCAGRTAEAAAFWTAQEPHRGVRIPLLLTELVPPFAEFLLWTDDPVRAVEVCLDALAAVLPTGQSRAAGRLVALACRGLADIGAAARARRDGKALERTRHTARDLLEAVRRAPADPFADALFPVTGHAEGLTTAAELGRLEEDPSHISAAWDTAAQAWAALDRPWQAGYCEWRLAESLFSDRARRLEAATALRRAASHAQSHVPLTGCVANLARLARVTLDPPTVAPSTGPGASAAIAPPASTPSLQRLTDREQQVLVLVAAGRTNNQIGRALFISPKTAGVHVSNLLRKFGAGSRVELAVVAERAGYLDPDDDRGPGCTPITTQG